jgi:hypothetical protein
MELSEKQHLALSLELLVNNSQKSPLEEFYGIGTKIKIVTMDFLPTKKVCNLSCKIILGEEADSLSLETDMATLLMGKILTLALPDYTGVVTFTVDV